MQYAQAGLANCSTIDDVILGMLNGMRIDPGALAMIESCPDWIARFGGNAHQVRHGELVARIASVSDAFQRRGMLSGDVVLFAVRPGIDALVLMSALLLSGALVVGLDPGVGARLFAERMKLLEPSWVVAESIVYAASAPGPLRWWLRRRGMDLPAIHQLDARFIRVGRRLPGVPRSIAYEAICREPAMNQDRAEPPREERDVLAFFTSGTTAAPKLVVHGAASLGAACACISVLMALRPGDVVYSSQTHQMFAALAAGARCVVPPARPAPARFIADIERHDVTHVYAVPFELAAVVELLERRGRALPDSVRTIILGSAPVSRPFLARLRKTCAPRTDIWCAYAMSEMFPFALVESREKLAYKGEGDLVGRPVEGAVASLALDGELLVAGPNLFSGYLGQEAVVPHPTGDLARIDALGRIVLLGRKKDMIIRGHHNLYPSLYEDAIAGIPGVRACAFVGVPTPDGTDERLILVVEAMSGVEPRRLRRSLERSLRTGPGAIDAFAHPDAIVFAPVPTAGRSQKLDRRRLAEVAARHMAARARGDA